MMNLPFSGNQRPSKTFASSGTSDSSLHPIPLSELLDSLVAAVGQKQPWVGDFSSDQVMVSNDLFEVVREFARLQGSFADTNPLAGQDGPITWPKAG